MKLEWFYSEASGPTEGALRGRIFDELLLSVVPRGQSLLDLGLGPRLFSRRAAAAGYSVTAVDARTERIPEPPTAEITFVQADVRVFDVRGFDVVAILGLLYHLTLDDQLRLLSRCAPEACVTVDTQLHDPAQYTAAAGSWAHMLVTQRGYEGIEFPDSGNPMASVGNVTSFSHTQASICRLFEDCGFVSLTLLEPCYVSKYGLRRFFVAGPAASGNAAVRAP
jgi:hypothetical protein